MIWSPLTITAAVIAAVILGAIGYWLIIVTEGTYLGRRIVGFLYDVGASTYDDVKQFSYSDEFAFLAKPLFDRVAETAGTKGVVLDVATGTGRLPVALLDIPFFQGDVVGVDISHKMLAEAARKFDAMGVAGRVHFVHHPAVPLPFADNFFDAVVMLEALEFLPDRDTALREMVRVLRPGGWFLVSNRIGPDARLMPGKVDSPEEFESKLSALGLERIFTRSWQTYYSLVWAQKPGTISARNTLLDWHDVLVCPACTTAGSWRSVEQHLRCNNCSNTIAYSDEGVLML